MARYHFGQGAYSNFADPLSMVVAHLRTHLYTHLALIANHMMETMNRPQRYPATHLAFRKECERQGETPPPVASVRERRIQLFASRRLWPYVDSLPSHDDAESARPTRYTMCIHAPWV